MSIADLCTSMSSLGQPWPLGYGTVVGDLSLQAVILACSGKVSGFSATTRYPNR